MEQKKCFFCEMLASGKPANQIMENEFAFALFEGYYREGHCTVVPRRHIEAFSQMRPEEYAPTFDLIVRVSRAL